MTLVPGQRVQLHPGTDRWMRGDRYGTVKRIESFPIYTPSRGGRRAKFHHRKQIYVTLDRSKQTLVFGESQLLPLSSNPVSTGVFFALLGGLTLAGIGAYYAFKPAAPATTPTTPPALPSTSTLTQAQAQTAVNALNLATWSLIGATAQQALATAIGGGATPSAITAAKTAAAATGTPGAYGIG